MVSVPIYQELRRAWPWPRSLHARLIDRLAAAGARLIVLYIIFADPTTPGDDRQFAAALGRAGNVILAQTLELTRDPAFSPWPVWWPWGASSPRWAASPSICS